MGLKGSAFLAIWHDIAEGAHGEYIEWHTREHMPERVSIPGFNTGKRLHAPEAGRYVFGTIYAADNVEVFRSPAYLERLNNPTPWTSAVAPSFRNFLRVACDRVATAADRCARIVRSFLAMARQREAERMPTRLETVADEAIELLAYNLRSSGIAVLRDWPDDLPVLSLDASQIHQVVLNLLVNAQQALEQIEGTDRRITLRIAVDEVAGAVSLSVDDNGRGVPEAIRGRIFDPFFTTKPVGSGLGLGLSLSYNIIKDLGGTLAVAETGPAGTRFLITLEGTTAHVMAPLEIDA